MLFLFITLGSYKRRHRVMQAQAKLPQPVSDITYDEGRTKKLVLGGTTVLPRYHFFMVPVPWSSQYFWYSNTTSTVVLLYGTCSQWVTAKGTGPHRVTGPESTAWLLPRTGQWVETCQPITEKDVN